MCLFIYTLLLLIFCVGKCTPLQAPKHGVMLPQQPRNFNFVKRLIFFCNYGFTLQGPRSVDCGVAGKWSNAAPICV